MSLPAKLNCPHCNAVVLDRSTGWYYILDTPLRTCPKCQQEYLFPYTYEWSIISPFHKFFYCFLCGVRFIYPLCIIMSLLDNSWIEAAIVSSVWILHSILRIKIFDSDKIKESYKRTKNNPEYIKKLSDMGYMPIDIRIDPYYK